MKKALITGVTGQDGSYLAEFLLEKNYDITAVSRSPEKAKRFKWFSKVKFIKADINHDPHLIDIGKNIGLFHLAWQGLPNYNSLHHFEENLPKNYNFLKN